jgi:hypothetical protein
MVTTVLSDGEGHVKVTVAYFNIQIIMNEISL